MIHIVGLYKCGTSWLLHILGAHPQVVAWREFDPVRACFKPDHRPIRLPRSALDYLSRRADEDGWMQRREASLPRSANERFQEFFLGRGWIPAMGAARQQEAAALAGADLDGLLDQLLAIAELRVRRSDGPLIDPKNHRKTLGVVNCRRQDLIDVMGAVQTAADPGRVPGRFYDFLQSQVQADTTVVTKAADQLMQLDLLRRASPAGTLLAIIRDGRDAAISARHYEALMREREAPWRVGNTHSLRRLLGWGVRAAKLATHARRGDVTVIRYEDLHADFDGTCRALLAHLNLRVSERIIQDIAEETSFENVSGGRRRGESAREVVRSGRTGEWRDAMSSREAALAWRLIGRELEVFGYSHSGELAASPLVLGPASRT